LPDRIFIVISGYAATKKVARRERGVRNIAKGNRACRIPMT